LILSSDESVVREKAISSLKIVASKISDESVYNEYMPLVKKLKKGD
jgi:serine/threonine-protein phosphatase 2A regulatory subunit A